MAKQKKWKERPVTNGYPSDVSDEEWLLVVPYTVAGIHMLAFSMLMVTRLVDIIISARTSA